MTDVQAKVAATWKVWVCKVEGGRLTLPVEVQRRLGVQPGDMVVMTETPAGLRLAGEDSAVASRTGHGARVVPTAE